MRNQTRSCLLLIVAFLLASMPASAVLIPLTASLDCSQANAGAGTCGAGGSGSGSATISYETTTNVLDWTVTWSGLSAPVTVAHFHGPAFPNQNAGVQVGITASSPSVGSSVISASQAADLLAGLWYLNIHSTAFLAGEIRGQVTVVPEPATLLLVGMGAAALGLVGRRQARARAGLQRSPARSSELAPSCACGPPA